MTEAQDAAKELKEFKKEHDFFIGIDSDGCAFDSMEIKHKECFIPNIIKYWKLQAVSKYARDAAEFVNLYSKWRGVNRFPALVKVFDLLMDWDDVKKREVEIPEAKKVREFIASGLPLGNPALKQQVEKTNNPELKLALEWSEAVNRTVEDIVEGVPPFPYVRESLEKMKGKADMVVVSATPCEALAREWQEHDIAGYVKVIAGQEMGKKEEHLAMAAAERYKPENILMIGDAPGDMKAARANNALFYPVIPGKEDLSWKKFLDESVDVFFRGEYAGEYEDALVKEFLSYLPETPPWKK